MSADKTVLKVSEIKPNPQNPRIIRDDKFKKLVKSLKDFPIMAKKLRKVVVDEDNVILGGNMRFKAIKEAGMKEVHVEYFTREDAEENNRLARTFNPEYQDKTYEEQCREFVIKDNVSGGEWDWDLLANNWDSELLDEWGLELPAKFGDEEVEEDEAPEVSSEPPVSKLGEIYQLGRHRVMCGDSTDKASVELLMNGLKPDGVHTDPPYGLGKKMSGGTWATKASHYSDMHEWDKVAEQSFFDTAVSQGCDAVVWGGNYFTTPPSRGWLIWKKPNFPTMADCEIAYTTKDMNAKVLESNRSDPNKLHPTQKPMEVTTWALGFLDGENILDLFLGSGSTLIACEQLDRTCYGMEIDPKYVDVIRKRYAKFINEDDWEAVTPEISTGTAQNG